MASSVIQKVPIVPRTRQRKVKAPPVLEVPDIQENAAERKRVLNILAQRRYRQRKRQFRQFSAVELGETAGVVTSETPEEVQVSELGSGGATLALARDGHNIDHLHDDMTPIDPNQRFDDQLISPRPEDIDISVDFDFTDILNLNGPYPLQSSIATTSTSDNSDQTLNPSDLLTTQFNQPPKFSQAHSLSPPGSQITSFPDSYLLPMSELTLLRAFLRIATRLNAHTIWDMTANSPFNTGDGPSPFTLPPTWQPTPSQLNIPHHPVVDLLPWPGVRDRMIDMMNLSGADGNEISVMQPSVMRDGPIPALLNFIYDVEDGAEGIRIWGSDPYDGDSWEVGQVVFERWWFLLDRAVVERSNHWRRLRRAGPLRMSV